MTAYRVGAGAPNGGSRAILTGLPCPYHSEKEVMQMAVPIELVGAWRRSGLLLDGGRKVDYDERVWLQTPECFVDIRLLIDPKADIPTEGVPDFFYSEFAFAGVT